MRWNLLILLGFLSCKTDKAVETARPEAMPVERTVVAPPAETPTPTVTLPPVRPLPAPLAGLPEVPASTDNPTTAEKAELGWMLFFDKRLSKDNSMACESCHHIAQGYTSGQALDAKVGNAMNKRNAPPMVNLGFHSLFYWDGRMPTLEAVSLAAWKGQLGAEPEAIAKKLNAVPEYQARFQRAFAQPATAENIPKAFATFFRTLTTGNSAWDKFQANDKKALSKDAQAGYQVFLKANCNVCHVPPLFTDHDFHNIGWSIDNSADLGRQESTKAVEDTGKFKTPSLRNVALTGPYFHDGKAATLDEAIDFMLKGGQPNPHLDPRLRPQKLSKKERAQLKAFLESLTGEVTYPAAPALPN